ncbi:zinc finger CCCH domain-containing protein 30 [Populus alba]|uniref:Zinc finger CCCH domain-containing protein 30-like n=1 Tax=Populus alba TaxID=43335 RepID=A0A4U5PML1_POPAL|nr:zinc finger CCCH domain-containing protein 30-like [Populus alba]XP_034893153.1 zinc finger CCCH domain-containing protein 30-like [Populus alba]XP_034893154.1 zinc finger CCCH domain-containing protein 30-like [Populus alba]XP_034893155.1 zinc finger CCCH domain-containing protein 30-like [Populus alba]XP_034893156.1 zinc finger CCCH domain-containing protein 30-like [Populus alba]TKR98377.1 zinc finger CCCH domain-containing protein 30-like [Populus alba]
MCCRLERLKLAATPTLPTISSDENQPSNVVMNHLTVETEDTFASLLELAANNDVEGFKQSIERDLSCVDEIGLWYGRKKGSKQMINEHRTPLMVAATYGSLDVIKVILSLSYVDVNRSCGVDKSTALHCAASGGALNAVDVVKLLLAAGADCNLADANGHRPIDVIVVPPKLQDVRLVLKELLAANGSHVEQNLRVSIATVNSNSPPLSPSMENGSPLSGSDSPTKAKLNDGPLASEKKEYPVDPSLPDIKNSIYSTDEFRMYSFKVRPCSRAYSHDWTECPFVHPGENARRRDPRKFHYSCVPCPDFRKGACRRGDMCEYAHGVFECWLHPAQYRTRLCKDGTNCARRVCFFAHTVEELRPLYVSTGSAVPSPRSSTSGATAMDFAAAMNLLTGSPSAASIMSPSPFTPPMSPSANGISQSSVAWPQPNVPALHLPGSNLQSSRLRSSLNARDIPADYNLLPDFDGQQQQLLSELSSLTQPSLNNNSMNHSGRLKTLTPSNLDDLFLAENSSPRYTGSSPRYADQALASAVFSPSHKSAVLNQFQQQQQSMLSPINTNFSPKNVDHPLLQASFASGRMSPRNVEPISPMSSRVSMLAQREKQLQQLRSLSSRELGSNAAAIVGSPVNTWSKWGSSNGKPDWTLSTDELGKLCRSNSFEFGNGDGPDLSWVQSLVKESPTEMKDELKMPVSSSIAASALPSESSNMNSQIETIDLDKMAGSWVEPLQIEQLVAQQN